MADYFLWLLSVAVGNIVAWGEHWGRLPWSEKFQSPERVFVWLLVFIGVAEVATKYTSPLLADLLAGYVNYLTGITAFVIGTFYVWFIWSGDWDFLTDYKWVLPVVCYLILGLNVFTNLHCAVNGISYC